MADTKISALTAGSTVDAANDLLVYVDVSDTSMAPTGTTKRIHPSQVMSAGGPASFSTLTTSGLATLDSALVTNGLSVGGTLTLPTLDPSKVVFTDAYKGLTVLSAQDARTALGTTTYVHNQGTASATWSITHNLNAYPSVTVVDSTKRVGIADVTYVDENSLTVSLQGSMSGKAYLNF